MNKKALNIALCLLLAGCSSFYKNKEGENINKNAPIFVSPKTNAIPANKPAEPKVEYKGEKYILVKETDLNLLINRKASEPAPNKPAVAAPAATGENSPPAKIGENSPPTQSKPEILSVPVIRLEPIEEKKASGFNWPLFFLVSIGLAALLSTVLYLLYYRPQKPSRFPI
jgi:hypothetical protein